MNGEISQIDPYEVCVYWRCACGYENSHFWYYSGNSSYKFTCDGCRKDFYVAPPPNELGTAQSHANKQSKSTYEQAQEISLAVDRYDNMSEFDFMTWVRSRLPRWRKLQASAAPRHSEWNKVKEDGLPGLGQKVLLCINGVVQKETFELDGSEGSDCHTEYFWGRDDIEDCPSVEDDHWWMLLPARPKEIDII